MYSLSTNMYTYTYELYIYKYIIHRGNQSSVPVSLMILLLILQSSIFYQLHFFRVDRGILRLASLIATSENASPVPLVIFGTP